MANPTTNYGWPMPTSTDLVTDLPADFAAFGQPVDTSLKALNPETTLGDIAYRSATSNTNTRLGIGTTGQVLTVASGVPSWATPASTPTFLGCALAKSTAQSLTSGAYTNVTFDVETIDVGGFHESVTNPSRITIPSGKGGYYLVVYAIVTSNGDSTGIGALYKNGSRYNTTSGYKSITIGNGGVVASSILSLAAADYIEVAVYSGASNQVESAAQNNVPSSFGVTFLGV